MKLIVGLGNPEAKYDNTRHNVGFEVIDELARRGGTGFTSGKGKFVYAKIVHKGESVILQKPLTYMNLSGSAVVAAMHFWKIEREDLLVVCDDLNIPLGKIRLRAKGSAGGQNGLKHIIQCLGRDDFARLRVGIAPEHPLSSYSSFVLGKFTEKERQVVDLMVDNAASAALMFIEHGIERAMNRFN